MKPTVSSEVSLRLQEFASNFVVSSNCYSSFQQSSPQVLSKYLFSSQAFYATDGRDGGHVISCANKTINKALENSNSPFENTSEKLDRRTIPSNDKQKSFDKLITAKLKREPCCDPPDRNFNISLALNDGNSSSDNSEGGGLSKGGSGGKRHGGGRKQSGSDKNGFINCLSCGLPCSKLDTECKWCLCLKMFYYLLIDFNRSCN